MSPHTAEDKKQFTSSEWKTKNRLASFPNRHPLPHCGPASREPSFRTENRSKFCDSPAGHCHWAHQRPSDFSDFIDKWLGGDGDKGIFGRKLSSVLRRRLSSESSDKFCLEAPHGRYGDDAVGGASPGDLQFRLTRFQDRKKNPGLAKEAEEQCEFCR